MLHRGRDSSCASVSGGGIGGSSYGPSAAATSKGNSDQGDAGGSWLLLRFAEEQCLSDGNLAGTKVAHFWPVIGESARRCLLTKSVCVLVLVPKGKLIARRERIYDGRMSDSTEKIHARSASLCPALN